jgi:hypothetical protein
LGDYVAHRSCWIVVDGHCTAERDTGWPIAHRGVDQMKCYSSWYVQLYRDAGHS